MPSIKCTEILFDSTDYELAVELRHRILRKPLGLNFSAEELKNEISYTHLAAFSEDKLVACCYLIAVDDNTIKIRQVAVDESLQRQGFGKSLMIFAEKNAKAKGFKEIVLNARDSAKEFYLKLNYTIEGKGFSEIGIHHFKMKKTL